MYRKIDPRIWNDEKFSELSLYEKSIAIYILTAQANRIGIFKFSPALAAEDLGDDIKPISAGIEKVCEELGWKWSPARRVLYIPSWWKYNEPRNWKVLQGCLTDLQAVPQTDLISEFLVNKRYLPENQHQCLNDLKAIMSGSKNIKTETRPDDDAVNIATQEQEQEQEQEQDKRKEVLSRGGFDNVSFTLADGKQWTISSKMAAKILEVYPISDKSIDVGAEFLKASCWLEANANRRKTARGMPRFLNNWLANAGKGQGQGSRGKAEKGDIQDVLKLATRKEAAE